MRQLLGNVVLVYVQSMFENTQGLYRELKLIVNLKHNQSYYGQVEYHIKNIRACLDHIENEVNEYKKKDDWI